MSRARHPGASAAAPGRGRAAGLAALALLGALASGCGGEVGTLEVSLVAAPESDLLDRIERVRAVLSSPRTEVEAVRDPDGGLSLALEVGAANAAAVLTLEGFDAAGERIALAQSPPLPVSAVNAAVTLYVAPPLSLAGAPVALDAGRSEIGAAPLPFGAILIGGRGAGGRPVADAVVYNVYDHELQVGLDLPAERAAPAVMVGQGDLVYVFGGLDDAGQESSAAWSFNIAVAPAGFYASLASDRALGRAGASGVYVASETFLVTGSPAVRLNGVAGQVEAWPDAPPLADGAAARVGGGSSAALVLAVGAGVGGGGAVTYDGSAFAELDAPDEARRSGHALVQLPDGRGLVVGGERGGAPDPSAVLFDPADGRFSVRGDFLATARTEAAAAAAGEVVLVAGGADAAGAVLPDAEVFDADSLAPIASLALVVPRRGASALALPNGQILVAGGLDADGQPVAELELFTPDAP